MYKQRKSSVIVLERELITSNAILSLKGKAPMVLLIFLGKRQLEKLGKRGHEKWVCTNNGEIEFTYLEAEKKYGWGKKQFSKALKDLHAKGFIDIADLGGGYQRHKTKYSISERWRTYDTDDFDYKSWPEDNLQRGFRKPGHKKRSEADSIFSTSQKETHIHVPKGNTKPNLKAI